LEEAELEAPAMPTKEPMESILFFLALHLRVVVEVVQLLTQQEPMAVQAVVVAVEPHRVELATLVLIHP
jgi:hypothetical protein